MTNLTGKPPSLLDLWMSYHFDLHMLAAKAGVTENTVQAMFCNQPIGRAEAEKILTQLSTLLHKECTLDTVYVPLVKTVAPHESKSEVARLLQKIDAEYQSSWQATHGFTLGTAQHKFITKRMENIAEKVEELCTTIGYEAAMEAYIAWQDQAAADAQSPEMQ